MVEPLNPEELEKVLEQTGALMEGHFLLSSGLHSDHYMQCARLLQFPDLAERVGASLVLLVADEAIDAVAAPAVGGIIVAHETARALGVRAVFSEREGGVMTFRRGMRIEPGERVLVVEDVITTGGSIIETIEAVKAGGGRVAGAGCILDRSGGAVELGYPLRSLLSLTIPAYRPDECPLCRKGVELFTPGSRKPRT